MAVWLAIGVLGNEVAGEQPVVFHNLLDQAGPQGANNCWYGYYLQGTTTFTTDGMAYNSASRNWNGPFTHDTPLFQVAGNRHPGPNESAVQRWSNNVDRLVYFSGQVRKTGDASGDGVIASIRMNNVEIWASRRPASDPGGVNFTSIVVYLPERSLVDLVVNPIGSYSHDMTIKTVAVHRINAVARPPAASSRDDFSDIQPHADSIGRGQWRYGHYTSSAQPATFTTNGWSYNSGAARWDGPSLYQGWSRSGGHPADNATDVVRRWTSQTSGTFHLHGTVRRGALGQGDGIIVRVYHNSALLHDRTITQHDANTFSFRSEVTVLPGDTLDLAVNRNVSYSYDSFSYLVYLHPPFRRRGTVIVLR